MTVPKRKAGCLAWSPHTAVLPLCLLSWSQIELSFHNKEHENGMLYTITATAFNEFGESAASEPFEYTTPTSPEAPVIDSIEVLPPAQTRRRRLLAPPTDRETFGSLAVTINQTEDGGSGVCLSSAACVPAV